MKVSQASFFKAPFLLPLVATVAFLGLVGTAVWQDRVKTLDTVSNLSLELAKSMANSLSESLTAMDIVALAGRQLIQPEIDRGTPDPAAIENYFLKLAETLPWVNGIGVFDANGLNIAVVSRVPGQGYRPFQSNYSVAENPSFQFHERMGEDRAYISLPGPAPSGAPQFGVSRRLVGPEGQFAGMITVVIPTAYVRTLFEEILPGGDTSATVFYEDSTWLVSTREDTGVPGQRYPDVELFKQLSPGVFTGSYEHDLDRSGQRRMIAFTRLNDFPIIVTVGRNKADILAGWRVSAAWNSAAIVLVISLVLWLWRRILQSAQATNDQRRFLQDTINALPNPIYIKDEKSRYVMVNHVFADRLDVPTDVLSGKTVRELGWPESVSRAIDENDQRVLDAGEVETQVRKNLRHQGRDGFEWMQITKIPFKDRKGQSYLIGTSTDVTDLKRREANDAQRQKLEALGRMAGGIAHEINNVLQPILVYSQMGEEKTRATSKEPVHDYFQKIQRASDMASALLSNMLAFARQKPRATELTDINVIVKEALGLLMPLKPVHVSLLTHFEDVPLECRIEPDGLVQVITNLLINAFDAISGKGNVTLSMGYEELDVDQAKRLTLPPGKYAAIIVSDTGSGISEDDLPHIFEPFFTTKETGEGTGLGMSVALGLVRDWDGTISVASKPGEGAVFTVYLPLGVAGVGTAPPTEQAAE